MSINGSDRPRSARPRLLGSAGASSNWWKNRLPVHLTSSDWTHQRLTALPRSWSSVSGATSPSLSRQLRDVCTVSWRRQETTPLGGLDFDEALLDLVLSVGKVVEKVDRQKMLLECESKGELDRGRQRHCRDRSLGGRREFSFSRNHARGGVGTPSRVHHHHTQRPDRPAAGCQAP